MDFRLKVVFTTICAQVFAQIAFAQMDRFLPEPEPTTNYGNDSISNVAGLILFLIILLNTFISWDGAGRLRLSIALICWLTLAFLGISEGTPLGFLVFISAFFVPLLVTEPIALFLERIFFKKDHLTEQIPDEKNLSNLGGIFKYEKIDTPSHESDLSQAQEISKLYSEPQIYEIGFEHGACSINALRDFKKNAPNNILVHYELGYQEGKKYVEDLKNIKVEALSEIDLFLTLLLAFEENIAPKDVKDHLVDVFLNKAREFQNNKYSYDCDDQFVEEVQFLIDEIEYLLFECEDSETV